MPRAARSLQEAARFGVHRGHHVYGARDSADSILVVCFRCGCYAQQQERGLGQPCAPPQKPSSQLLRVQRNLHPGKLQLRLDHQWPWGQEEEVARGGSRDVIRQTLAQCR